LDQKVNKQKKKKSKQIYVLVGDINHYQKMTKEIRRESVTLIWKEEELEVSIRVTYAKLIADAAG
jgi:hypothetical protein